MNKTVLVVDDDPTQRRLIQAVLEREGFRVAHADSAAARRWTIWPRAQPADVVLLDLVMPGLTGQETLADMRQRGFTQPVIVVTATGGIDTVVAAMRGRRLRLLRQARQPRADPGLDRQRPLDGRLPRRGRPR